MPDLSRRKFLIASAGVGAAGLLSGACAVSWPDLMREAQQRPLAEGSGVLVILTLYGGNDGINTVIPYADNAYHDARPELAYAPNDVLHLDDQLGLNPALKGLAQQWNSRKLAIVRGVELSAARPQPLPVDGHLADRLAVRTRSTGWIGRWLDATGNDPLRAVNIGSVLPPLAVGEKCTAAALIRVEETRVGGQVRRDDGCAGCRRPQRHARDGGGLRRLSRHPHHRHDLRRRSSRPAEKHNSLAGQLSMVAAAVKAAVPTRVYAVKLGGFDTHADERGTQQRLLQTSTRP